MKLTIFGATGATGTCLVQQALSAGHQVTAVVRDPARLAVPAQPRLRVVTADVLDPVAISPAVDGADARPRSARTAPAASSRPCRRPAPAGY
jgi:putative NADH-flavin reductase